VIQLIYLSYIEKGEVMENIEIIRPKARDVELINEFFKIVLKDTFERNGISDLVDTISEEIEDKRRCLNQDLASDGQDRYFLIARDDEKIVGSIEYGASNELILSCTKGELKDLVEIGTVFVHPDYQNKGIGTRMLNLIFNQLEKNGVKEFCLDSGYKTAQKTWIKKFGIPTYHLKDYWGPGADHMIWRVSVDSV
jgi:GNAT superfamily N-acetyltransferase